MVVSTGSVVMEGVVSVPAPDNYDDSGLLVRVDPNAMWQDKGDLHNQAQAIADSLSNIARVWEGLALGWVGASAEEAQDFNNRWNQALRRLFGTDDDPRSGALPNIAYAVALASINYAEHEDTVVKMFNSLTQGLSAPSGGLGVPTRSNDKGPVTESAGPPL